MDIFPPPQKQVISEFNPIQQPVIKPQDTGTNASKPEEDYVQQFIKANVSQHGLGFNQPTNSHVEQIKVLKKTKKKGKKAIKVTYMEATSEYNKSERE